MRRSILFLLFFSMLVLCRLQAVSQTYINSLRTEYLENPLGIDESKPRFTWKISSDKPNVSQKAFQIIVDTIESEVASGRGRIWNSGSVNQTKIPIIYNGSNLQPFTRYYWTIRILDSNNQWSKWADVACFETGMMNMNNWRGAWISDGHGVTGNSIDVKEAPYFRKGIRIDKKILSARAYIAVAGLYELYVNGEKVGDHILDPMFTRFDRRNLYVTYDIGQYLEKGDNVIGVVLGNGWYNHQSTTVWYFDRAPWRNRPTFCMDVRLAFEDGTNQVVSTGNDWKTSLGGIVFNSIYTGEHFDARLEQEGWNIPGFDDSKWNRVNYRAAPSNNIVAQAMHPIRYSQELTPVSVNKINDYTWVFDIGKNIAGVTKLTVSGNAGTVLRIKHGEKLDSTGFVDLSNISMHLKDEKNEDPFQTDIFTLSGKSNESFMAKFNYKGFQYVEVTSDYPLNLSKNSLTAFFMHSDVPKIGHIHSSDSLLNRIWRASNSSYLANLYGYPTDCPQREKNGWTGDGHIVIETGLYNFDGITIYEKWLADHQDEQQPNGVLPSIIPTSEWGYHGIGGNGPDWTSSIAIIPWNIYLFYGDSRLLERCYENIKRYVEHYTELYPSGLVGWGRGDWVPVKSKTPIEFSTSIYYYVDLVILSKAAKLFNLNSDFEKYSKLAEKTKNAINEKYLDFESGSYGSNLQTELSAALYWDIVPQDLKEKVAYNLSKRVIADNKHIDVGLLGSKTILNALSENGYSQLAWEVASQKTYPSWGWWIANGASTFYENWSIDAKRDLSMNHIMFGEINAWYYKGLGGIYPDEKLPGFKNILLKPNFVNGLNQFEALHEGPYGQILSSWKKIGKTIEYKVHIPENSTATLMLNGTQITENNHSISKNQLIKTVESKNNKSIFELQSGKYIFHIK